MADLEKLAGLAGRHDHAARALERVRHLLLAVHVFAGLQAIDRVLRVPEVRSRDDHRVELFLLVEHLAVVFVGVRIVLEALEAVDDAFLVVLSPHVADRPEAQARNAQHRVGQHLALGSRTEEGDIDLLQAGRGCRRRGDFFQLRLLVLALFLPRVAEEAERRDRGQPLEHVPPIELSRRAASTHRLRLVLLVLASHCAFSPPKLKLGPTYDSIDLSRSSLDATPRDRRSERAEARSAQARWAPGGSTPRAPDSARKALRSRRNSAS